MTTRLSNVRFEPRKAPLRSSLLTPLASKTTRFESIQKNSVPTSRRFDNRPATLGKLPGYPLTPNNPHAQGKHPEDAYMFDERLIARVSERSEQRQALRPHRLRGYNTSERQGALPALPSQSLVTEDSILTIRKMFAREMGAKRDNMHSSISAKKKTQPLSHLKLNVEDSLEEIKKDQAKLREMRVRR